MEDINGSSYLIPIRGLKDVNNTCWFNCILQCLKHTPNLFQSLEENSQAGQKFLLPGGKVMLDDESSVVLPPLDCALEKPRSLTNSLQITLSDLAINTATAYKPNQLYSLVIKHMPRFEGRYQQDAYEFFRNFLEALRMEDVRRHQAAVLVKMNLTTKSDPTLVKDDKKRIIQFYGLQIHDILRSPSRDVFRGSMKNTLICQCTKTTHQVESFFDLCLPIPISENHFLKRKRRILKIGGKLNEVVYDADDEETFVSETCSKDFNENKNEELEFSVELCLRNFFAIKVLSNGDNSVKCDGCSKQNAQTSTKTQLKISSPPSVLVLNFKRFLYVHHTIRKISTFIKFSTLLDITSFCSTEPTEHKVLYSLYAVVKHSGKTPNRGRYVAYSKRKGDINKHSTLFETNQKSEVYQSEESQCEIFPDKWYYTNDQVVEEISEKEVLRTQAYILFYERIY